MCDNFSIGLSLIWGRGIRVFKSILSFLKKKIVRKIYFKVKIIPPSALFTYVAAGFDVSKGRERMIQIKYLPTCIMCLVKYLKIVTDSNIDSFTDDFR